MDPNDMPEDTASLKAMVEAQNAKLEEMALQMAELRKVNAQLMVDATVPDEAPVEVEDEVDFEDIVQDALDKAVKAYGGN